MKLRFPQRDEIREIADSPAMAVDLGFARKEKRSCGLVRWVPNDEPQPQCVSFGQCVEDVAEFLSENTNAILIVEAPLSGLFDSSGNPKGRVPFEKASIDGKTITRYWYVGAGAAVGLGAIFLFSHLSRLVMPESNVINVVEGFVSFKTRRSDDVADARALLEEFRNPGMAKIHEVKASAGEQTVNMLSLAGLVSPEEQCPAVLVATVRNVDEECVQG